MHKVACTQPRPWSSYTNVYHTKDDHFKMNSVEDLPYYRENIYCSPALSKKTSATTYDFPEHPPKKDKKWSFGSLFRRKKKDESESSSDEEAEKRGYFSRKKKKSEKRKKAKQRTTFDHIVVPQKDTLCVNGYFFDESGILSDPTGGFGTYQGRTLLRTPQQVRKLPKMEASRDVSNRNGVDRSCLGSADSLLKKNRRDVAKIRAEARRETYLRDSSSDDDSQRSSSSKLRSDENINRLRDGSMNKKSRAARTERYIRRLSKDEEVIYSNLKLPKSDVENGYQQQKEKAQRNSNFKAPQLSTIPPSHFINSRENVSSPNFTKPPISTYNLQSKYGGSLTSNEPKHFVTYKRSVSYDDDINRTASPEVKNSSSEVIHAQLSIVKPNQRFRNLSLVEQPKLLMKQQKQPPPPPPRDPWRILANPPNVEATRPMSYCYNNNHKTETKPHSFNWKPNFRSTSEDHLPSESSPIPFYPRPASATTDHPKQRIIRKTIGGMDASEHYQYLADRNPRSRKPIFIQDKNDVEAESKKAIDFWKKIDEDMNRVTKVVDLQKVNSDYWRKKKDDYVEARSSQQNPTPQMFTASTKVRTNIFLPSADNSSTFRPITEPNEADEVDGVAENQPDDDNIGNERKSSNLEDALDELEAIYNSLRLGDEDLLERAEEREKSIAAKRIMEANLESYPGWGPITRGAMSDSNFSYEPFDSIDSPKRKKLVRKPRNPDRKKDDMALRKLQKERNHTASDPKEVISRVSYLLASPVHHGNELNEAESSGNAKNKKEPDVTYDDVVFRTIKHANNTLKVSDPQPLFGIPIGPVLPAPSSDYLHAVPEKSPQFSYKNKRIPDVVKDDLAFRNLRKDSNKEPVLPVLTADDVVNNNNSNPIPDIPKPSLGGSIKKKRAVRSLSANIYNLMQNDPLVCASFYEEEQEPKPFEKPNLADIADAMEIARQILKEKEQKISATRRAFLSDTEEKCKRKEATEKINEGRLNFLNSMKSKQEELQQRVLVNGVRDDYLQTKPPRGVTPEKKNSKEPPPKEQLKKSSLDDLLTAFAVEAQEASQRIADEIRDKSKSKVEQEDGNGKLKSPALVRRNSPPKEIIGAVEIDTTERLAPLATTELHPVEEDVEDQLEEQLKPIASDEDRKSVANLVVFCEPEEQAADPIEELGSASDHDYVNLATDAEPEELAANPDQSGSPFQEPKFHSIAGFEDLKNIDDDDETGDRSKSDEEGVV